MRTWIKNPLAVWTGDNTIADGGIVITDAKITELLESGESPADGVDEEFDASNLVIVPGLINCHHHFYQTLTRAFPSALNKELFPWLLDLYPIWAGLDEDSIVSSTELALAELMLNIKVTTIINILFIFNLFYDYYFGKTTILSRDIIILSLPLFIPHP